MWSRIPVCIWVGVVSQSQQPFEIMLTHLFNLHLCEASIVGLNVAHREQGLAMDGIVKDHYGNELSVWLRCCRFFSACLSFEWEGRWY